MSHPAHVECDPLVELAGLLDDERVRRPDLGQQRRHGVRRARAEAAQLAQLQLRAGRVLALAVRPPQPTLALADFSCRGVVMIRSSGWATLKTLNTSIKLLATLFDSSRVQRTTL